jgi:hypothetical protein
MIAHQSTEDGSSCRHNEASIVNTSIVSWLTTNASPLTVEQRLHLPDCTISMPTVME